MALEDILKKTNKKLSGSKVFSFGSDTPSLASEEGSGDVKLWIPTGIWPLDVALGGGLALGRITELFSDDEGEGKTTLVIHTEKSVQQAGGTVIHLESESALDKLRAGGIGLNLDNLIKWTPDTLEDGFRFVGEILEQISADRDQAGKPTLIVWDTIAMARTEGERDGDPFRDGIGAAPRAIAAALKNYTQEFSTHNVHLLLVNQSYTDINNKKSAYLGPQMQTPGGKRVKFSASYRVKVKKCGFIGRTRTVGPQDEKLGIKVRVTIPKNKLSLPYRTVELLLYGNTGYSSIMSMAHNFVEKGPFNWPEGLEVKTGGRYKPIASDKSYYWHELEEAVAQNPETQRLWKERWVQYWPVHPSRVVNDQGWYERDFSVDDLLPTPKGIL